MKILESAWVMSAVLVMVSMMIGFALGVAAAPRAEGGGAKVTINFGEPLEIAAILVVGVGMLTFMWTLHRDVADVRVAQACIDARVSSLEQVK